MAVEPGTILDIAEISFGLAADRQIKETLEPIDHGELRRTVNGVLMNLTMPEFRKYRISLSAADLFPPTLAGIWKGMQVTVQPISEIADRIATGGTVRTLERDPVAGSVRCVDIDGAEVEFGLVGRLVTLTGAAAKPVKIFYRAVLTMLVVSWSADEDEWGAATSWRLELEEV
jgi:hypothetical protein